MRVLSLFDGMSCGQIALNRAGVHVDRYYASEIDKYAIKVAQANYPDTIQLGSVLDWTKWDIRWHEIDMVTGGFPCQSWSVAGKQLGDKSESGKLFWTLLDIIGFAKSRNPNLKFLIENVKMKREFEQYITHHTEKALGSVNKILINSALVSAQNRNRYYWHNIEGVTQPGDKGILLKDILENGDALKNKSQTILSTIYKENVKSMNKRNKIGLLVKFEANIQKPIGNNSGGEQNVMACEIRDGGKTIVKEITKSLCLLARDYKGFNNYGMTGVVRFEYLTDEQKSKLQQAEYYIKCGAIRGRYNETGEIEQKLELRKDERTNSLTTVEKDNIVCFEYLSDEQKSKLQQAESLGTGQTKIIAHRIGIRKLTPVECERLQTLPDNYTNHVSNSQRYKMIGNGWTVDVIAHIFRSIK